jgi:CheY-like chemotaxis protein
MNLRHENNLAGAASTALLEEKVPPLVLVVDDSSLIRVLIAHVLRGAGCRVREAADGAAARQILQREAFALVITDLEMPGGDGWDLLAYCHAQHPAIPVLIASGAVPGRRPEVECLASGFLPKPFVLSRLRAEIERLLPLAT